MFIARRFIYSRRCKCDSAVAELEANTATRADATLHSSEKYRWKFKTSRCSARFGRDAERARARPMHIAAQPSGLDFVILQTTSTVNCTRDHRNNRGEIGSQKQKWSWIIGGRPMLLDIRRVGTRYTGSRGRVRGVHKSKATWAGEAFHQVGSSGPRRPSGMCLI